MAKVVDTLVLNHFGLIKAIGTTLNGSELTFTISGKGTWCSIHDSYVKLPNGITTNGASYAWRAYTRSLYSSLTVTAYWAFSGLSEEAYYEKKEELANEGETDSGSPELPEIPVPDTPEIDDSEHVFNPEFIEFPDPFTGKT